MKFNQFSYIPVNPEIACQELRSLGFEVSLNASAKANFEAFVRKHFLFFEDTDLALKNWIADTETDLLTFFKLCHFRQGAERGGAGVVQRLQRI